MSRHSAPPRLPTRCPVCKGALIQRVSGRGHGGIWFQCLFCKHNWKVRHDDARAYHDGELAGHVFVVAPDGKRHSLGSVVLNAVPDHALTEHLERKTVQSRLESGKLPGKIEALAAILEEARAEENRLWNIQKRDEQDVQKANEWSLVYNKTKDLERQLEDLHTRQQQLTSGEYFLEDMPSPISSAQTDAGGKFTLLIPRDGRFGIVARASRELGEKKETYCWFVWVSLDGDPSKRLVLNNDNVVGAGSPDSALR
jgi:GNAT superfamily N-acetyltransferase